MFRVCKWLRGWVGVGVGVLDDKRMHILPGLTRINVGHVLSAEPCLITSTINSTNGSSDTWREVSGLGQRWRVHQVIQPTGSVMSWWYLTLLPPYCEILTHWVLTPVNWVLVIQVMACRLIDTKPSPISMLTLCQLDTWEQTSVKNLSVRLRRKTRLLYFNAAY